MAFDRLTLSVGYRRVYTESLTIDAETKVCVLTAHRPNGRRDAGRDNPLGSPVHPLETDRGIDHRHNQPFANPARFSPVMMYGHARINRHSKPDR